MQTINPRKDTIQKYMHGYCDMFARAAYKLKGWQINVLLEKRNIPGKKRMAALVHAFNIPDVNKPDEIFDAKGFRNITEVFGEYNGTGENVWLEIMSEEELLKFLYRPGCAIDPSNPCSVKSDDENYLPEALEVVSSYFNVNVVKSI